MPDYVVRDPRSNRTVTLSGDSPPTEAELHQIFASLNAESQESPSAARRFVSNAAEMLNPVTMVKGAYQAVTNPIDTATALIDAQGEQFSKAGDAFQHGRYAEALGHGAAGVLPVLGPVAADIGEQIGSGDVAGGLGAATGLLTPMAAARPAAAVAARAAKPLQQSAQRKVVQALGPTKERFKAVAEKRAPEILDRRLGGSRESLQQQSQAKVQALGQQIDATLQAHGGKPIPTQPIIDAMEQMKAEFQVTRDVPLADAMRSGAANAPGARVVGQSVEVPVPFEPRAIAQIDELQNVMRQLGPEARVDQLVAIRRGWDKVVADAGGYAHRRSGGIGQPLRDISEASIKRDATAAIRNILNDNVPDLAAINKEFAFWKDLNGVLRQTLQRTQPQGPGLLGGVKQGAGTVAGAMAGGAAGGFSGAAAGALVAGQLAKVAHQVFTSPRWRLVSARTRQRLAEALASGHPERISTALGRASAVTGGGTALGRAPAMAKERPEDSEPTRVRR